MSNPSHHAVEALGIKDFIFANWVSLYRKLEEAAQQAEHSPEPRTSFMTSSLPIVNGLIHFASSRDRLDSAVAWAQRDTSNQAGVADPTSTLAALALLYIVDNGAQSHVGKPEVWKEMQEFLGE